MAIGLYVIGDEILSGKRKDAHFERAVEILRKRGLVLSWCEYLGDDLGQIRMRLERSFGEADIVFSCGGIGATPDDCTRFSAALAFGVPLVLHPEAKNLILERVKDMALSKGELFVPESEGTRQRLKMGEFPLGSAIIPNPYNKIPGFSVKTASGSTHYFMPGFPEMAWPMIEWALDTYHANLFHVGQVSEVSMQVFGAPEAMLTPLMEVVFKKFPDVKIFSLPCLGDAHSKPHIELGAKGHTAAVLPAYEMLKLGVLALGLSFNEMESSSADPR